MMLSKPQFVGERELVKLSEIAKIKAGNVAPKKDAFTEDGIPFVRAGSLTNLLAGESLADLEKIDDGTAQKLRLTLFPAGTVVFAKSGMSCMTGNVYVLPKPCYVVSHLACVIPNGNYASYLKHYFRFNRPNRLIENPSFPSIKLSKIQGIELRLPSLEESVMQVQVLERIESQIEQAKALLTHLDSLVKSRFVEMFGKAEDEHSDFPVKTLNDVCTSIVRGPFGSALKKEFFVPKRPGAYKVYEQKHAIQKQVDIGTYYISRDRFETLKRFECHPGDILMSCSGTMGKLYQLPQNCEPGVMNQALCKFTLSNSITADYFLGFMEQVVDELGVKGSGIKNVSSVKFIKAIRIPLPPVELQERFAAFVSQVDKSRFVAQQQIEKLQMLYDSLAQEYFGD